MYYDEYHNHKWAIVLQRARQLADAGAWHAFYYGEDLPDGDVFPGVKVSLAYWISVEHEMKLRMRILLKGANRAEWEFDPELTAKAAEYHARFVSDMKELNRRYRILPEADFDLVESNGWETPASWADEFRDLRLQSEAEIDSGALRSNLADRWIAECVRSVSNYNRYLIWGGVNAVHLVKTGGKQALVDAVDSVAEEFMWEVSREFFARVMPSAGFEDLGDLMELGLRGMYADNYMAKGSEVEEGEKTIRISTLKNCQLMGIYRKIEQWSGFPETTLGYGICQFCEVHGQATMLISIPPMYAPQYRRLQSLALDVNADSCKFELVTTPADDMERILLVQEKVFGEEA